MHAVDRLGAALGTTIAPGVAPIATGLCARWWTRQKLTLSWMLGTTASVVGCVVLLNPWGADHSAFGVSMALLSGACYGVYTVAAKRFLQTGVPALPVTTITLLIAGVTLSPLLVLHPEHLADTTSVVLIVWLAVIGTAIARCVRLRAAPHTTAPTAGTLSLAEPLLAAALGVVILREHLSLSAVFGCLALLVGLVIVTLVEVIRRPASRAPDEHLRCASRPESSAA